MMSRDEHSKTVVFNRGARFSRGASRNFQERASP